MERGNTGPREDDGGWRWRQPNVAVSVGHGGYLSRKTGVVAAQLGRQSPSRVKSHAGDSLESGVRAQKG